MVSSLRCRTCGCQPDPIKGIRLSDVACVQPRLGVGNLPTMDLVEGQCGFLHLLMAHVESISTLDKRLILRRKSMPQGASNFFQIVSRRTEW